MSGIIAVLLTLSLPLPLDKPTTSKDVSTRVVVTGSTGSK